MRRPWLISETPVTDKMRSWFWTKCFMHLMVTSDYFQSVRSRRHRAAPPQPVAKRARQKVRLMRQPRSPPQMPPRCCPRPAQRPTLHPSPPRPSPLSAALLHQPLRPPNPASNHQLPPNHDHPPPRNHTPAQSNRWRNQRNLRHCRKRKKAQRSQKKKKRKQKKKTKRRKIRRTLQRRTITGWFGRPEGHPCHPLLRYLLGHIRLYSAGSLQWAVVVLYARQLPIIVQGEYQPRMKWGRMIMITWQPPNCTQIRSVQALQLFLDKT